MLLWKAVILLCACAVCSNAIAQRYNFTTYNTNDGLPQSQVFGLQQAADGQLWMASLGGISRFDGKTFYNYTTTEGLAATYPIHFVLDHSQRIWAITTSHLNMITGNKVYKYPLPQTVTSPKTRLAVTNDNVVWCLVNGVLYSFSNNRFVKAQVAGYPVHDFLALIPGEQHTTWLMAPHRTLYGYNHGVWQRFTSLVLPDTTSRVRNVYIDSARTVWIQTQNGIMVQRQPDGKVQPWLMLRDKRIALRCITKDQSGNFWVGGNTGAYRIKPDRSYVHFDYTNGYSLYRTNDILQDREGNIWLGTDGDGLLKYAGGVFTVFDTGKPGRNNVQVATADSNGHLYFGNTGSDFCMYDGRVKKRLFTNGAVQYSDINFASTDSHNTVWIGTSTAGLWKLEKGHLSQASFIKNSVYGMSENENSLFFRTEDGLLSYSNGALQKNTAIKEYITDVIGIGKDSLLVAKQFGIALLKDTIQLPFHFPVELQRTNSATFAKTKEKIFIGTIGEGIFVWDKTTGAFNRITTAEGLATNIIYSLLLDKQGQLWAGTGKGISRLVSTDNFHTIAIHNYGRDQGFNGLECNGGAIACWPDNTVWFGTTKGIYAYHPEEDRSTTCTPQLIIQSARLSGKNHITFEFRSISFSYNNIRYSYFLQGPDNNFSAPDHTNSVVYPSLPPGNYIFKVKAIDETGKQLGNMVTYSFSILPAFYQTGWFKLVLTVALMGMIFLFYKIRRNRVRKQQALVEKLRIGEQNKIRKKTSQDFHDEMGNKLARIIVLSEILKTKLPTHDEAQGLAQKIIDNVALMYRGTKDIIWSLNPENDNLQFLLLYINNIGIDFFVDIGIEFEPIPVQAVFGQYYLPMDYSRNIIMICKEVFTNICKHAQCSKVTADAKLIDRNTVQLAIADNGKGFDTVGYYNGNGLTNIKQRVHYLSGDMQLHSEAGKGTRLTIIFTIPPERYKKKFNETLVTHP